jgi:uncharacterized protein (UPF0264 family)
LLVSVRSEAEARAALAGGAAIIDVKEPSRGPLGMARWSVWRQVRGALPSPAVVSVALGELREWSETWHAVPPPVYWKGIGFRKLGLAGAGPSWREHWLDLRQRIEEGSDPANPYIPPAWVAVVYLDWEAARAPEPGAVIDEAAEIKECRGVLFDTWDKTRRTAIDSTWRPWINRAREAGRFVALAGSLDESEIRRLRSFEPNIFAVRGAACRGGDRNAPIDPDRVARLVAAAGGSRFMDESPQASPISNFTPWANGNSRP